MAGLLGGVLPGVSLGLGLDGGAGTTSADTATAAVPPPAQATTTQAPPAAQPATTSTDAAPAATTTAATTTQNSGLLGSVLGPNGAINPGALLNPARPDDGDSTTATQGNAPAATSASSATDTPAPVSTATTTTAAAPPPPPPPAATTTVQPAAPAQPAQATQPSTVLTTTSQAATTTAKNAPPQQTTAQGATSATGTTTAAAAPPPPPPSAVSSDTQPTTTAVPNTLVTSVRPPADATSLLASESLTEALSSALFPDATTSVLGATTALPDTAASTSASSLLTQQNGVESSPQPSPAAGVSSGGLTKAATIGIATGAGVAGVLIIVASILACRRYWRNRRESDDAALAQLDMRYESEKPIFEEKDTGRWNKALEQYHDATRPNELGHARSGSQGSSSSGYRA